MLSPDGPRPHPLLCVPVVSRGSSLPALWPLIQADAVKHIHLAADQQLGKESEMDNVDRWCEIRMNVVGGIQFIR